MPRQVRDSNLETRTARSRLKARHKPYLRLIEPGVHVGYRKLSSGPGTWVVRRYQGRDANGVGVYTVKNLEDDRWQAPGRRRLLRARRADRPELWSSTSPGAGRPDPFWLGVARAVHCEKSRRRLP